MATGERTAARPWTPKVKLALIGIADHVVLLADSAKLRQAAAVPICDNSEIDALVTEAAINEAHRAAPPPGTRLQVAEV